MTISPDDVRQKRFRIALRGYVVEEVDAFMDEVERALTNSGETTDTAGQALHTLRLAEQLADQLVSDARAEATAVLGEAEAAARTQATALLNQARTDARDLLADAQDQALQRKGELQAAIAELQAMERAQREQLRLLLQEQLRVLSEPVAACEQCPPHPVRLDTRKGDDDRCERRAGDRTSA